MWGKLGVAISLLIVLTAGAGWYFIFGSRTTAPTVFSTDPKSFAPLLPPGPPPAVMGETTPTDCGPLVRQAISLYLANRPLYDDFAAMGKIDSPKVEQLDAIEKLVEASSASKMTLFASSPDEVVNYKHTKDSIDALRVLGRILLDRLALLNQRGGRPAAAARYAQAAMALGLHLCRERVCYAELDLGLELVSKSALVLAKLADEAGETERAAAWRAFDAQRVAFFKDQIEPVVKFIRSVDPKTVGTRAGDVFELAKRSRERMWRVEAVLALGRMRYFAGEGGTAANQRAATALLTELAQSEPDPVVRAAAKAARDLTLEEYRMQ